MSRDSTTSLVARVVAGSYDDKHQDLGHREVIRLHTLDGSADVQATTTAGPDRMDPFADLLGVPLDTRSQSTDAIEITDYRQTDHDEDSFVAPQADELTSRVSGSPPESHERHEDHESSSSRLGSDHISNLEPAATSADRPATHENALYGDVPNVDDTAELLAQTRDADEMV